MEVNQLISSWHVEGNVYSLLEDEFKKAISQRETMFRKLFSQVKGDNSIQSFLLQSDRESEAFARSNKSMRKLENMIDVLNFSLFDFELMNERLQSRKISLLLEDMIAILKCTKKTVSQEVVKVMIDLKTCEDIFVIAVYAAIRTINQLLKMGTINNVVFISEFENMRASLIYAIDEQLS